MRKKLRFWTGAAFGAALQYFYDPKAGQARRALLRQRVTDRLLDAKDGLVAATCAHRSHRPLAALEDGALPHR